MLHRKIIGAAFALLISVFPAAAQSPQLGAGQALGNSTAAQRPARPENITDLLDRAFGSTRGSLLERGASGWGVLAPGTTARPLISAGAGADPAYGLLTGAGIAASTVANSNLVNPSTTVNGQVCTLGAACTVTAAATSITVGSTTVVSGTSNGVLTNSGGTLANTAAGTNGQLFLGVTSSQPAFASMSGDATITNAGVLTLGSTVSAGGPTGSATVSAIITYDAKGRLTAVSSATITPAVGSVTGLGTGVATALGVNVGSAGAFVTFNGAGGTPSSMTATNLSGTAAGLTAGTANAVAAANITGATLAAGVTASSLTSVGTLTGGATGAGFTVALGSSTITGSLALTNGGAGGSLTASNGGIVYSDASRLQILAGTVTSGQCLLSGSSAAPSWGACAGGAAVSSVTAGDTTLTISPTTGAVVAQINLARANTWTGAPTFSGVPVITSGNFSAAAWTTAGVRIKSAAASYTDTSSSGTVAAAYTDFHGAGTILASSSTTFTNYYGAYFVDPVASTNVTMTNKWSIGADSLLVGTSNSFKVSTAGHVTIEGVTSSGATGTANVVFSASPTFSGTVAGAGTHPLSVLATQAADTAVVNATGGSASPTAVAIGSCSAASSALTYNTTTHAFGCNTISGGSALSSKVISFTRVLSAGAGNVAYTGVGFVPTSCEFMVNTAVQSGANGFGGTMTSMGYADSSKAGLATASVNGMQNTGGVPTTITQTGRTGAFVFYADDPGVSSDAFTNYQTATVNSYDADGFTLAYLKTGSPTITATIQALCFK